MKIRCQLQAASQQFLGVSVPPQLDADGCQHADRRDVERILFQHFAANCLRLREPAGKKMITGLDQFRISDSTGEVLAVGFAAFFLVPLGRQDVAQRLPGDRHFGFQRHGLAQGLYRLVGAVHRHQGQADFLVHHREIRRTLLRFAQCSQCVIKFSLHTARGAEQGQRIPIVRVGFQDLERLLLRHVGFALEQCRSMAQRGRQVVSLGLCGRGHLQVCLCFICAFRGDMPNSS